MLIRVHKPLGTWKFEKCYESLPRAALCITFGKSTLTSESSSTSTQLALEAIPLLPNQAPKSTSKPSDSTLHTFVKECAMSLCTTVKLRPKPGPQIFDIKTHVLLPRALRIKTVGEGASALEWSHVRYLRVRT
ncbi:hypothetical protein Mapa_016636 [Marchantia paleacea]|nr:hypothetical protein Mapa_016636 [Marchantia paleacea]